MKQFVRAFALLGAGLSPGLFPAMAQTAPPAPLGCLIEPWRVAEVGSPVIGVIESVRAERGDRVRKGQALATLRADVEKASVDVAATRAQAIGELNAAVSNAELARQKLARAKDLADRQFISAQALEQARSEAEVAENRLAQAREQRGILAREHELAQAQLQLRTIRSPSDGIVADRYLSAGERVEEKPMFRVAVVDPLRVEVILPAGAYGQFRSGMGLTITPEFPSAGPRQARVVLVDRLIDGASNTFRVRLELPNAGMSLPAGLRCKADLSTLIAVGPPASRHAALEPDEPGSATAGKGGGVKGRPAKAARAQHASSGVPPEGRAADALPLRMDATLGTLRGARP